MTTIEALQEWYSSQCNQDWEHTHGVEIGTLDNPGWSLEVDLAGTALEGSTFAVHSHGVGDTVEPGSHDWLVCKVEGGKFVAYGGPRKLDEMINVFLSWAKKNA
jgi:hypothetical protein